MNILFLKRFLLGRGRGNAMVEFAVAFGLLFPVLAGSFQFGYAFYLYNEMQTAVRAGARYASLLTYDSANATPSSNYENAIKNMVVYGDPAGGSTPIVAGLTPSNVTVSVAFDLGLPSEITVGVNNYRANTTVAMLDFNRKPHVTVPFVGIFDPGA
jgi:Flp pilus assembly protein TadG